MSKGDKRYAIAVCVFVFLVMGFCGWYENYVPAPQPNIEQIMLAGDRR